MNKVWPFSFVSMFVVLCSLDRFAQCVFSFQMWLLTSFFSEQWTKMIICLMLIWYCNSFFILVVMSILCFQVYLCAAYYTTQTDTYTIKWTTPHCVLTLRLIGLVCDVYDGKFKPVFVSLLILILIRFKRAISMSFDIVLLTTCHSTCQHTTEKV